MALKMTYNVDMCFCIDATGSMGPVINTVKQNALSFYKDVVAVMQKKQKIINGMRVKVFMLPVAAMNRRMVWKHWHMRFVLTGQKKEPKREISLLYGQMLLHMLSVMREMNRNIRRGCRQILMSLPVGGETARWSHTSKMQPKDWYFLPQKFLTGNRFLLHGIM